MVLSALGPCIRVASTISNLLLVASDIEMWYFALLYDALAQLSTNEVAEVATVAVLSPISEWLSVDGDDSVTNPRLPEPSVFSTWSAEPSEVGKPNPLMVTVPVPLPVNSRLAFDAFVETVLSSMVTPSTVNALFVISVVNVPAAGVVAPITVLSIVPLLMSAFAITICPVPAGEMTRSEFVVVVCGEIMTMPGLPSVPAADSIRLNSQGEIEGLF